MLHEIEFKYDQRREKLNCRSRTIAHGPGRIISAETTYGRQIEPFIPYQAETKDHARMEEEEEHHELVVVQQFNLQERNQ